MVYGSSDVAYVSMAEAEGETQEIEKQGEACVCMCVCVEASGLLPSVEDKWNDLERTSGQVTLRFRLMSS